MNAGPTVNDYLADWPWRSFAPLEIACKGCTADRPCGRNRHGVQAAAIMRLQVIRDALHRPLRINSAYRCAFHNAAVGGAAHSHHKQGDAFDISIVGSERNGREMLVHTARDCGFSGFGFYHSFLHVDCGRERQWQSKGSDVVWNS